MYCFTPTMHQTVPFPGSPSAPFSTLPSTLTLAPSGNEPTTLSALSAGAERMRRPPLAAILPVNAVSEICSPFSVRTAGVGLGVGVGEGVGEPCGVDAGRGVVCGKGLGGSAAAG